MHIELVVFDMAGTTVVDDGVVNDHLRHTLALAGCVTSPADVDAVMGLPKPKAIELLLKQDRGKTTGGEVARLHADFVSRMVDHYTNAPEVREVRGMSRAFERLRRAGVRVALDTGFDRRIATAIVDRLGWAREGLLDACVASDEVHRGRPHPDMIFEAMRRTGVSSTLRVVKVGDTPSDVVEGLAAGCTVVVAVTNGAHGEASLRAMRPSHLLSTAALVPELLDHVSRTTRDLRATGTSLPAAPARTPRADACLRWA